MAAKVFISYRRDDSAGHAGRVHDRLEHEFGSGLLFMDVDSVPLGVNFIKILRDEVAKCDVLLAVIGPNWLNANDDVGRRRLDNPHDFVRIEIATALQRDIAVIPILLDGAPIPKANQLPKDIRELAVRNGLEIRHTSFHSDMDKLIRSLKGPSAQLDAPAGVPLSAEPDRAEQEVEAGPAAARLDRDPQVFEASQFGARLQGLEAPSRWQPFTLAIAISGALAVAVIAASLFWVENRPPVSPRQASALPPPSAAIDPPPSAAAQPPPIRSTTITSPAPPAQDANTPPPQAPEKLADAAPPVERLDGSAPINEAGLLNEVRERLYELNFDPSPPDGPLTEADRRAIREFEQQSNLPPTGIATMDLLQRLRAVGGFKPWGAIVYGKTTGKWGMAWGETTRRAAVAHARVSCGDTNTCPAEISFFGAACGVFAYSGSSWAITARDNIGSAKEAAIKDCGKRGKSCEVVASVCADGADRFSAAK